MASIRPSTRVEPKRIAWGRARRSYRPHRLKIAGQIDGLTITLQGSPNDVSAAARHALSHPQWLLQRANDLSVGLWNAVRVQYGHAAGRQIVNDLAATALLFITLQEQLPSDQRNPALQRAQAAEAERWQARSAQGRCPDTPRYRRIRLAQFLVHHLLPDMPETEPDSFERRHIRAGQRLHRQDGPPTMLPLQRQMIAEGLDPRVRDLLRAWEEVPKTAGAQDAVSSKRRKNVRSRNDDRPIRSMHDAPETDASASTADLDA